MVADTHLVVVTRSERHLIKALLAFTLEIAIICN